MTERAEADTVIQRWQQIANEPASPERDQRFIALARATSTRRELDFYPTPAWMVDHLLDRLDLTVCHCIAHPVGAICEHLFTNCFGVSAAEPGTLPPRVFEPCVGAGNIVNAIQRRYPDAFFATNDLDERHDADTSYDATKPLLWTDARDMAIDWVITNPPFSEAFDIVRQAVETARVGVAMLLRTTWLEPTKTGPKAAWLVAHPPKWELVMERYSFDGSGSQDSAPTAWFVWSPYLESRIEVIPGRGRQEGLPL